MSTNQQENAQDEGSKQAPQPYAADGQQQDENEG